METSTVVPGGDLAERRLAYAHGYRAGAADGLGFIVALTLGVVLCGWAFFDADKRADRAEAQLVEMRAQQKQHTCVAWKMDRDVCMCQHVEVR